MLDTWDDDKNAINKQKHGISFQKHGISFETARLVFDDPWHLSRQDRVEQGEERWQTIGLAGEAVLLLVAHTWRDQDGEEHIRIISARRATKMEREIYEEGA